MNWMAPEVMERPYDERSDVWSLGCIVLELATCGFLDVRVNVFVLCRYYRAVCIIIVCVLSCIMSCSFLFSVFSLLFL